MPTRIRWFALVLAPIISVSACADDDADAGGFDTDEPEASDSEGLPTEPVACGDVTCAAGELCIDTGWVCVEDEGNRHFEDPDDHCAAPPTECEGLAGLDLVDCLVPQLCAFDSDAAAFVNEGTLNCPAEYLDCF